ncbi:hypothetical protein [Clostridium hydrogenum]|uniref:hypothetical protein n=1 Tax=Clostridium hydrogenum TaxID=2855764 RepID=UPI001F28B752|nr:hypothetical protein [Clostridium hydrogenum]
MTLMKVINNILTGNKPSKTSVPFIKFDFKKVLLIFFIVFLITNTGIIAKAAKSTNQKQLIIDNIKEASNGNTVEYNYNKANSSLSAKISSKNLSKGYYTTIFYNKLNNDFLNYKMINFNIDNESKNELRINFMINKPNGTNLSLQNNKSVLLKEENSLLTEKVLTSYGSIAIPKGFRGLVYIPFDSLGKSIENKKDKKIIISDASTWWGISITSSENEEKIFNLSNFTLSNSNTELTKISNLNFNLEGDNQVQIPIVGESISQFKANPYDSYNHILTNKITYKIDSPIKGISVTDDGILKIEAGVKPQKIQIDAIDSSDSFYISKEIQLYNSWTLNSKDINGVKRSIPQISEVSKLPSNLYSFFLSTKVLNFIRICFIILILICTYIFILSNKKRNNE